MTDAYGVIVAHDGDDITIMTTYEPDKARMHGKVESALRLELLKMEAERATNGTVPKSRLRTILLPLLW